ncbi:nuclear pore complex protein Nup98-Nup96-like isoform X5 [Gouania willdenowi]|uniref:nuclear pore complex protein Nup98-Nup96-like isoform X5 n=1 Tax=Gouania willdenowi TaxID=441366 RepID=UPI0010545988|nr:nuclear pore complex protein Nup98-Nup96-like isoform X5 [Gouania willdenowi]
MWPPPCVMLTKAPPVCRVGTVLQSGSMFNKSFATPFGGGTGAFGASSTFGQQNAGFGTTNSFGTSAFGTTTNSGGVFGSTQNKPGFGTSTSSGGGGLFGAANATSNPFGGGATSLFGGSGFTSTQQQQQQQQQQPGTTVKFNGLFGNTAASQARGLFGAAQTSTASGFGAATGLFGQTNPGFGNTGTQPSQFGNKSAGFGTTTTSAPSFGTGLFGNKPALTPGTGNNTSTFGSGANPAAGSLFGNKTTTGGLYTGLGTSFSTAVGPGHSLFGNNQKELGSTLGTMGAFGASGSNTGTSTLGFGPPQQPVALSDLSAAAAAAQQQLLQQQLSYLAYSPYGDSPLFRNPLSDTKKEERLKLTNPTAQKALTTPTHYKLTPRPASRRRPKALPLSSAYSKSCLFDLLDDEPLLTSSSFIPRKSIKKLVLKNMSSSQYSSVLNGHTQRTQVLDYFSHIHRSQIARGYGIFWGNISH